jgi:hypothetical protein
MKKTVLAHLITNDNQAQLHFNRRLPHFDAPHRIHPFFSTNTDLVVPRPKARLRLGRQLAKHNAGQNSMELGNPVEAYRHMLDGLSGIDGLIHLHQVDAYTLHIVVGKLFNVLEIGHQVAKVIGKSFFHGRLQFTAALEHAHPQPKPSSVDGTPAGLVSIEDL